MEDILFWALAHGDKILNWVLVFVGGLVAAFVLKQMKDGAARSIVSRALTEVGDAVLMVTQTYVSAIKAASADGKLTTEEKKQAKQMAIDAAKKLIGPDGLKRLVKVVGGDLDGWLSAKIEAALGGMKGPTISSASVKVGEIEATASVPQ